MGRDFGLDSRERPGHYCDVRVCVIFNPAARGRRARKLLASVQALSRSATLLPTTAPGSASELAAGAAQDGFDVIVAAGGDGTINEVLNGICRVPGALDRVRLGVLPVGTMNVFAREMRIPRRIKEAWELVLAGTETRIDIGVVEFGEPVSVRRCFLQLAGVGLDARAIELVNLQLKQWIGPVAYVLALVRALASPQPKLTLELQGHTESAEFVLIGNGKRYGGPFRVFPEADPTDGALDVCLFKSASFERIAAAGLYMLLTTRVPRRAGTRFRSSLIQVSSPVRAPVEVDGELAGYLPARFTLLPRALRLIAPAQPGVCK